MNKRLTLHIVDSDSRSRAEQARIAFALGHHAEVYSDFAELISRPPGDGIVLLRQKALDETLDEYLDCLGERGAWMPLIVCAEEPRIEQVVAAIKSGALDYLALPLDTGRLARSLAKLAAEAKAQGLAHHRLANARRRIAVLSKREREVLELLALGSSNKLIARELSISPRTVEIHRSNMMTKLRAGHAAEAIRLWLQAELEGKFPDPQREDELDDAGAVAPFVDFRRLLRERSSTPVEDEEEARGRKHG